MQADQVGFESSFKQHLDAEQRRAVLEAIGARINPDSTIGEVIDAAEALGWSEQMSDLSLADLAEALLAPEGDGPADQDADLLSADEADEAEGEDEAEADEDEGEDEDEAADEDEDADEDADEDEDEEEDEVELAPAPRRTRGSASKKASKKPAARASKKPAARASKKPAAKASKKPAARASKKPAARASKKPASKASKAASGGKKSRRKPAISAVDVDERMSLDQAAAFFLPHVEALGEATMQALEEQTGVSRRKLRFHIGQLVKHGYLERHGMGRGTFYTPV
ncbi:MAG: hypothetical protein KDK70_08690 [Myxococcales bacterium]|nr:hypothetical protein [Myxococcales bacterium]